jgi:hypothetical protein
LSYSAYSNPEFKENFWLIGLEYSLVMLFLLYENMPLGGLKKKNIFELAK